MVSRPFFRRFSRDSSTKRVCIWQIYCSTSRTTFLKGIPEDASSRIFSAVSTSPEEAEQELNTWTLRSGSSSSSRTRAWTALLWEPLSRADRVTT